MKGRRIAGAVCLAALLALGCLSAFAEDATYYAGFFDYYYHAHRDCALAGTVSPISAEEVDAQGKYPCPACVDDATKYKGVEAVARGGTLVIRVPDAWMRSRDGGEMVNEWDGNGFFWSGSAAGREAATRLAELLHGADYRAFLDALAEEGEAHSGASVTRETSLPCADTPYIDEDDGGLLMHRRHIGAAWYLTYRPGAEGRKALNKKGRLGVPLSFDMGDLRMDGDALDVLYSGTWKGESVTLKPKKSKGKTRFAVEDDALFIAVFPDMGVNICVVHERDAGKDSWPGGMARALQIDGVACMSHLMGYTNGDDAIYCGVLTEAEAWALESGASYALTPVDRLSEIEAGFATAFDGEL